MVDHVEHSEPKKEKESLMEKITEKFHHDDDSSSSSGSDSEKKTASPSTVKDKIFRLFEMEKPVHQVFGGGKPADVFLWRNKKISAAVLGGTTATWVLFELLEYHLLSLELTSSAREDVVLAMNTFIKRLLAVSNPSQMKTSVTETSATELAKLLYWLMMVGYSIRNIEVCFDMERVLGAPPKLAELPPAENI